MIAPGTRHLLNIVGGVSVKCPHCKIGPMIPKPFGYYQCRLVDLKYVPSELDTSLFNPLCLLMQKLG